MAVKKTLVKFICAECPYLFVKEVNAQFINGQFQTDNEEVINELRIYPQIVEEK